MSVVRCGCCLLCSVACVVRRCWLLSAFVKEKWLFLCVVKSVLFGVVVVRCWLLVVGLLVRRWLLPAVCCLLFVVVRCVLFVVCCGLLLVVVHGRLLLRVACWSFIGCVCMVRRWRDLIVCLLLCDVCCALFVVVCCVLIDVCCGLLSIVCYRLLFFVVRC